ncbi:hypothetical protein Q1M62_06205 (plasmid) [Sinorhizobium meliloti]|nr:hypothetical protein LZK74_07555 [Sinorhizobium meliloti]WKL27972.1 hypothetical protein Q1M65_06565 [Sinorhizobium meliloti]WKL33540.1 hypothetical protein Q1M62_06205 [Sinorhizobium meliloti]
MARKTSDRVMTTFTGRSPALRDPAVSHLGRVWSAEPARIGRSIRLDRIIDLDDMQ